MEQEHQRTFQASGSGPGGRVNLEELRLHYGRQIQRWGDLGGRSLKAEVLRMPGTATNGAALVRVEALARANRSVGYGSADAGLLGSNDAGRLLECAELLAKIDAVTVALKDDAACLWRDHERQRCWRRPAKKPGNFPLCDCSRSGGAPAA